ncbi:MAG TPA: UDP-2,3-diacylglucosamine diphosphatase [Lysobacter sp.]
MTTLFISDLHLDETRPQVTDAFVRFAGADARGAEALYILGDLFEAWVGDDDPSPVGRAVADALQGLAASGVPVHFMRGNRDFLVGDAFARRAGMRILPDPAVVLVDGAPVLLMHGDTLCTGDTAYQAFRTQTRDPAWQAAFLAQPLQGRLAFAAQARAASRAHQSGLQDRMETLTDVAPDAVARTFERYGIDTLVHGHTHRPAVHELAIGARRCRRIVLGDWYDQGSVLCVADGAWRLERLPV